MNDEEFNNFYKYEQFPIPGHPGISIFRRMPRRKTFTKNTDAALRRRVLALEKEAKKDLKGLITALPSTASTSGSVTNVAPVAQGNDTINREGDVISGKSLLLKGLITQNSSAVNTFVRICVVRDKLGNTTAPTIAQVFGSTSNYVAGTSRLIDPQNTKQFDILVDQTFIMGDGTIIINDVSIFRKLRNRDIVYTGTGATDEGIGGLWCFLASNQPTNVPTIAVNATLRFTG